MASSPASQTSPIGIPFFRHRKPLHVAIVLLLVIVILAAFGARESHDLHLIGSGNQCPSPLTPNIVLDDALNLPEDITLSGTLSRKNIVIASSFAFHHDVYMAVAWTIERVLRRKSPHTSLQVYAATPFAFGFQTVVEDFRMYRGGYHDPKDLIPDLLSGSEDKAFDLIVFGTCEASIDLKGPASSALLAAWDSLAEERKFKVVCIVHNVLDTDWQSAIIEWSRRDAIRLLPLSEHVGDAFRHSFNVLSDSKDRAVQAAGLEYIPIDVHVPILDVPGLPERPPRTLSNVVIQGSFSLDRRNYARIFEDLIEALSDDPEFWGYRRMNDSQLTFEVNEEYPRDAFHLYLLGSGWLEIPEALKNVVSVHTELDYLEFYSLMSTMDICLPAFADYGYYDAQASSTFVMALECNVPILLTERTKQSYRYAADDRVVLTRPAAIGDIAALRALRAESSDVLFGSNDTVYHPLVRRAVDDMIQTGWNKDKLDFEQFKQRIWSDNEVVVDRILRDL